MNLSIAGKPDWPSLALDAWDSQRTAPNVEAVAVALDQRFIAAQAARPILLYVARLFPEGFLPVPIEVVEPDGHVPLFVYPNGGPECASHFAASSALLSGRGLAAVYCAPELLDAKAIPVNPLRPFVPEYLGPGDGPAPQGKLGMWWATPQEPLFSASVCFQYFDRMYTALDGVESYVFGALASALGLVRGPSGRVALPPEMNPVQITGPDLNQMFFSGTTEKSIRFRFALDTPSWYRDAFWRLFTEYVEQVKQDAVDHGWPLDPSEVRQSLGWWKSFKSSLGEVERKGPGVFIFGVLIFTAGSET